MRDGKIVQSGKYDELLDSGIDFEVLVAAHANSMELVEQSNHVSNNEQQSKPSDQVTVNHTQANGQNRSTETSKSHEGKAKLINEEQRETGHVSFQVYKLYGTEARGWWGVVVVLAIALAWQGSLMASLNCYEHRRWY